MVQSLYSKSGAERFKKTLEVDGELGSHPDITLYPFSTIGCLLGAIIYTLQASPVKCALL